MNKEELKENIEKIYNTLLNVDTDLAFLELTVIEQVVNLSGKARNNLEKVIKDIEKLKKITE